MFIPRAMERPPAPSTQRWVASTAGQVAAQVAAQAARLPAAAAMVARHSLDSTAAEAAPPPASFGSPPLAPARPEAPGVEAAAAVTAGLLLLLLLLLLNSLQLLLLHLLHLLMQPLLLLHLQLQL